MPTLTDRSNGYEAVADEFAGRRRAAGIGLATIRRWARQLRPGSTVLDLGCGSGDPVARELSRLGFAVAGIDASPSLIAAFHRQLPDAPWACEAVEASTFFGRRFDAILAVGLMFLLSHETQQTVIGKVGDALETGGRFLFTAPREACEWMDALTGRRSVSLGARRYESLLLEAGLAVTETWIDEGENHYFSCRKQCSPTRSDKSPGATGEMAS
jgi:2-polyprenyl-3-methyl-5-hydroxy-6-metoxy-1,4-benzoquinol methylase